MRYYFTKSFKFFIKNSPFKLKWLAQQLKIRPEILSGYINAHFTFKKDDEKAIAIASFFKKDLGEVCSTVETN